MPGVIFDEATRRSIRALRLHTGPVLSADGGSVLRSKRIGHGGEFHEHRDYLQGDDPRHIDWNLYGRMGELYVKRFRSEADLELRVLFDDSASMALGEPSKRILGLRLAATLVTLFQPIVLNLDLRVLTDVATSAAECGSTSEALFNSLEQLEPGRGSADLRPVIPELQSQRNRVVFLISDFLDDAQQLSRILASRSARTELVLISILAPDELEFAAEGHVEFVDAESGETFKLVVDQGLAEDYRRAMADRLEQLEAMATRHGARFVFLSSPMSLSEAYGRVMRRGGMAT